MSLSLCDPFSITALALSAAASAAAYQQQQQQAENAAKYQNEQYRQAGVFAAENYTQQTGVVSERLRQNAEATGQSGEENAIAAMQARATATAAAGEAGVTGNSVDQLLADFSRTESLNAANLKTNQRYAEDQANREQQALRADARNRIVSNRPGPVNYPSTLGLGLQIGAAGLSSYNSYSQYHRLGPYNPNSNMNGPQGSWMFRRFIPDGYGSSRTFS